MTRLSAQKVDHAQIAMLQMMIVQSGRGMLTGKLTAVPSIACLQVYRMSSETIGCSLAEAAESDAYQRYLEAASQDGHPGLHVVYINTSLRTKALAHTIVPTITCTSSNVVQTVLQASPHPSLLHRRQKIWRLPPRAGSCPSAYPHIWMPGLHRTQPTSLLSCL